MARHEPLTVFKALFDRTRDRADIEEMISAGSVDAERACGWLRRIQGAGSPGARHIAQLADAASATRQTAGLPRP